MDMQNTKIASGKVREIYDAGKDRLLIVTTDRISAFDVIMPTPVPDKGRMLNLLSLFWFDFTKKIIPNHLISAELSDFPEPFCCQPELEGRAMLVRRLKMLPVECVVRGYLTGSGFQSYQRTGEVCGVRLPAGLLESQRLPKPIFTPTTKAATGHDEAITFEQMENVVGPELARRVRDKSVELYTACADYARSRGILIADTKFEFGLDEDGTLTLGDEVLTPDSSRFWSADDYRVGTSQKSFDKQYLRDWLISKGLDGVKPAPQLPPEVVEATIAKYRQAYEKLAL